MKMFHIGIVGAGRISHDIHIPVLLHMPNVSIEWVTDINKERVKKVALAYGLKAIELRHPSNLPNCDVALLAIPVGVRADYYQAFAQKGVAVFAEKPFALTLEDHKRFLEMFPPYSIGCGYMRRMYGSSRLLKQIISEGWFGEPIAIRISEGGRTTATGVDKSYIDELNVSGGGVLMELGCHTLDLAFFITNATGFEILEQSLIMDGQIDRKVDAKFHLFRGFEYNKCLLDYCVSWLDRQKNTIEVEFPNILLVASLKPDISVKIQRINKARKSAEMYFPNLKVKTSNQAFFMEWSEFFDGLENKKPSAVAADKAALTTDAIDQLYRNVRK